MKESEPPKSEFDPITLEIFWSRLISIADESAAALLRTSFSTIVRESNDFATVLMDENGDGLSENTGGIASFNGILPRTLRSFLEIYPKESLKPGDCIITNDPWLATGHLPDITMAMPIFYKGEIVGFSGSIAHSPDIGGALWGADCRELYEEGIHIPPLKFLREGKPNKDLLKIIQGNVRVPDQVLGDLYAQVTANEVCGRRLCEFLDDSKLTNLTGLSAALLERADWAMRQAILAVPDGTYRSELWADGFDEDETHIKCAITIEGSDLTIDYTGTSKQITRGINCVMNYTDAYSVYPVKCALDPETPRNEGSYRPMRVIAPEGCILNPTRPAPVNARQLTGHLLAGVIYKALVQAVPDKVIADCGGAPTMRSVYSGYKADGSRFSQILFASGGMGATPISDGLPTTAFPTNAGAGSIEAFESIAPLIVWSKELRQDSGGAGQFRGGLGQDCEVEVRSNGDVQLSVFSDRRKYPAEGLLGGKPGATTSIELADGVKMHPKSRTVVKPGTRLLLRYAGGGGYGDPSERDPQDLKNDIRNGYVSQAAARTDYA